MKPTCARDSSGDSSNRPMSVLELPDLAVATSASTTGAEEREGRRQPGAAGRSGRARRPRRGSRRAGGAPVRATGRSRLRPVAVRVSSRA
jgi:hypothetical protein